jgi:CBS domain-containing protein
MGTVADILRQKGHGAYRVKASATMQEAAGAFLDKDVNSLLVMDGDAVAGLLTRDDLLRQVVTRPEGLQTITVGECAGRDFFTASPDDTLGDLFKEMIDRGIHHVPVLDGGRPAGMITSLDVVLEQKGNVKFENEQMMQYIHGRHYE